MRTLEREVRLRVIGRFEARRLESLDGMTALARLRGFALMRICVAVETLSVRDRPIAPRPRQLRIVTLLATNGDVEAA